jgi:glycosyltransferase involved in cell wall biosynthesis
LSALAFLSPVPPAPTGIADYSAEVLALLAPHHAIDVFHHQDALDPDALPASCGVFRVEEFLPRHRARPYDLALYQLGNGPSHAFQYAPLCAVPGLLVLHDLVLHQARALVHLDSPAARAYARDPSNASLQRSAGQGLAAYAAEVAEAYPAQAGRLSQVHLGTVGRLLPYAYPLFRQPVEASRLTAVHNACMADSIRNEVPGAHTALVSMPMRAEAVPAAATAALRQRLGLSPGDLVVGSFGLLTREKQILTVARAVARASVGLPHLRLLLVGPVPDPAGLQRMLEEVGVAARTVVTGRVALEELPVHLAAMDIAVHLRYPTARETSAALLRLLAQGRPTVISDLVNLAEIPDHAALRVDPTDEEGGVTRAIERLAASDAWRARLSAAAAGFIAREHSAQRCQESYQAAIDSALRLRAER